MSENKPLLVDEQTKFFFEITPDRILEGVEAFGLRCTGRCLPLNSMENRVYEVEVEVDDSLVKSPSDRFRVVKFYRPGRWSKEQLQEEHDFLLTLQQSEIPVVAPLKNTAGATLLEAKDTGIYYTVFPKQGGRCLDELNKDQLIYLGRLIARTHNVGATSPIKSRLALTPDTYGLQNLNFLLEGNFIPPQMKDRFKKLVEGICAASQALFKGVPLQRIHGDCHVGNILWGREGAFLVDFDDMVNGPCVQDLWLVVGGRDEEAQQRMEILLSGYEQMRPFNRRTLNLIEALRALRMIHFSAWIARRWNDPAFKRVFVEFGTERYWVEQICDLDEQLQLISTGVII